MYCNTPGFPVLDYLPEFAQTHTLSQWCHPTISYSVIPFSSCLQSFPVSGSFLMCQLFASGGQSIGASAASVVIYPCKSRREILTSCLRIWGLFEKRVSLNEVVIFDVRIEQLYYGLNNWILFPQIPILKSSGLVPQNVNLFGNRVVAWRIPGMGEPGGLPSMGSHGVGHDWRDLAASAAAEINTAFGNCIPCLLVLVQSKRKTLTTAAANSSFLF